jgi:hypothetical protein
VEVSHGPLLPKGDDLQLLFVELYDLSSKAKMFARGGAIAKCEVSHSFKI